ncbi:MAG: ornithine cyclodeaminase, partial [Brachybacterium sp.]|nr:ornithine cyclodeaminase [Brachybacterium sp.]
MTDFVGVQHLSRYLARTGVQEVIAEMTDHLEKDFVRWPEFEKQPRIASHSPVGVIELMPAADAEHYAFKYVNGHPANPMRGYQTVTAFGALAEVHNGYPVLIAEMTLLTALRTAAMSSLAAKTLARPDSRVATLIGTGCQAPFQALGLRAALGIEDLRIFDTDPRAMDTFTAHAERLGFRVHQAASAAEAADGADVITTCTADKRLATVLHADEVPAGAHINGIGGDCPGKTELEAAILERAEGVFVEFAPQTRIEGDIQQLAPDFPVTELWEVTTGIRPGRTRADAVTVFDSVGFAVEDFSALTYLYERLRGSEFVEQIDLVADPHDPKDLFSLVAAEEL